MISLTLFAAGSPSSIAFTSVDNKYLICGKRLMKATVTEARNEISEAERMLQVMIEANPAVQTLIDMFNLELVA